MTFSYNDGDLTTDLNKVRRLIGDVNSTSPEFQDEEINFFVEEGENIYGVAALACKVLAAKYAQKVTKSVDGLSIQLSQKYDHYKELAITFSAISESGGGSPQMYCGGISKSDKDTQKADTDRVEPDFYKEQFDFQGTISTSTNV